MKEMIHARLSSMEVRIVMKFARGMSKTDIAREEGISTQALWCRFHKVRCAVGVETDVQLAVMVAVALDRRKRASESESLRPASGVPRGPLPVR